MDHRRYDALIAALVALLVFVGGSTAYVLSRVSSAREQGEAIRQLAEQAKAEREHVLQNNPLE